MLPNILLIVFDTARVDAFEPYGAPPGSGPALADLARRGLAVPNVYSTSNWTLPAHASMFTGLLPWELGLVGDAPPAEIMKGNRRRLLAPVLASAGYRTAAVSANAFVSRRHGFDIGFERFEEVSGSRRPARSRLGGRLRWGYEAWRARLDDGIGQAEEILRGWLAEPAREPFFWFVNLMECHSPYLPPRPYNDLSFVERIRAGEDVRRFLSYESVARYCLHDLDIPRASLDRMRHLYARAVRSMDDWVGRLVEDLDRRRMLDDTLVIVTSDHGENLGEEHLIGHVMSLDDRLLRVPLVLAGPGAAAPDRPVTSLAALPRLVAEAVGLDRHPWRDDDTRSEVAVAQSDGFRAMTARAVEGLMRAWNLSETAAERVCVRQTCATDGRFKLVREAGRGDRLYDLTMDPTESRDVFPLDPENGVRLAAVLEGSERRTAPAVGPESVGPGRDGSEADRADLEERLRLLGYI